MTSLLRMLVLASFMIMIPAQGQANKLLMPGEVIKGHIKEEEVCENCHKKFDKKAQSQLCMNCHKDIGKDVSQKRGYHGRIEAGKDCKDCHAEHKGRDFKAAEFDHDKFDHAKTDYPLKGKHAEPKVKCEDCHKSGKKFSEAPSTCISCHKKEDEKTHKGKFGDKCEGCHIEKDWKDIQFDHDRKTKYPLRGKHKEAKCSSCHKGDLFKDKIKVTTCVSCHKKDDDKSHKGKFGAKCETCHIEKDWKDIQFDHDKKTKYPLLGKHKEAKCTSCHKGDLYKDKIKVKTCVSCHQKDDDKTHKGKFGTKCETCHVEKEWKEILFDHAKKTKYPLLGKHKEAKCSSCHKGDLYKDKIKDSTCIACHEKDDKHKGQEGKKCETCHKEESWTKTTFNHNKMSKFALLGRHALVDCKKCHAAPTFKDAPSDCWSCHEKDDAKVHKRRFGTECQDCHNTRDWMAWDFNHDKTNFKLDGPHKKLANKCYACHAKPMGKKVVLATACGSCHDRDDVHNGNFGDRCDRCHDGNDWKQLKVGVTSPEAKVDSKKTRKPANHASRQ
ncbi:MAG TPA: cytochrome C [Gallionella sp.]